MRVGIDATCWSNNRGYGRFTRSLIEAMIDQKCDKEFVLFVDSGTRKSCSLPDNVQIHEVPTKVQATKGASADGRRSIADMLAMSHAVNQVKDLDVFFFPTVYSYFPVLTKAKIIVGIHDVIAEDYPDLVFPSKKTRMLWNAKSWLARKQADMVLTVSQHAKAGLKRKFGLSDKKLFVVDEAPDPVFRRLQSDEIDVSIIKKYKLDKLQHFFLYVGGINPHKNLVKLAEAFKRLQENRPGLDLNLVIVGDVKDGFTPGLDELKSRINSLQLQSSVIFTGFIPDDEIVHIMNLATALVLPSFAEGFGLPAMEAAACGTPIIATENSPLPDLLPGAGFFINPESVDEIYQALESMLKSDRDREQLSVTAFNTAQKYTWQRSASQMSELLNSCRAIRR